MHELQRTSRRVGLTVLVSVHACVCVRVCAFVRARARDAEKLEAQFETQALTLSSLRWERDRLLASCRPGYRALCTRCAGPSSQVPRHAPAPCFPPATADLCASGAQELDHHTGHAGNHRLSEQVRPIPPACPKPLTLVISLTLENASFHHPFVS